MRQRENATVDVARQQKTRTRPTGVYFFLLWRNTGVNILRMTLNEYIAASGKSSSSFASRFGVTEAAISYWLSGRRAPNIQNCKLIEFATAGAVRCEDLRPELNWDYLRSAEKKVP